MSLLSQLEEIQWKQLQHDETYHKDIWLLTVQQRITHMVLHLSKYSSKLTIAAFKEDSEVLQKTVIDALIIVFSSSNIFNKLLCEIALSPLEADATEINKLAEYLYKSQKFDHFNPATSLSLSVLEQTGKMCKVVESLDHLESVEFRGSIIDSLISLFRNLLAFAYYIGIDDIALRIGNRLFQVEKNNPYFKRLKNYNSGN